MEVVDESEIFESSLLLICNFLLGIIFFGGIAANLLVLMVFYRKPGLRTTANRFVINLMIINIVACISFLPIAVTDNSVVTTDNYLCFVEQFSSVFCSSVIVYSVLLIAIDQYFAVVDPLHYHCIISSCKGYFMIISTWVFSAIVACLGSIQSNFGIFHNSIFRQCGVHPNKINGFQNGSDLLKDLPKVQALQETSPSLYRIVFCVSYVTASFVIPFGLICFIYYRICVAASGNSKRTRTSILTNEDSSQALREKFQSEVSTSESPKEELTPFLSEKNSLKQENMLSDQIETSLLIRSDSHECSPKPSFVVTRPSPPRPLTGVDAKKDVVCECVEKNARKISSEVKISKTEEISPKAKLESEVPFLKPTLKNNSSFSKLSSLHIQFSNSTEKISDSQGNSTERRHSNIPMTSVDPEFENLSKTRSSSMLSNFCDIASRSSSSTRSTTASIHIQSSRSSSLNSTYARNPPSRASSIRSTSSYIVHNIRHRISNASLFRYREEARAARISAMVIVMALFCWLPFFTIFSLHSGICINRYPHFSHYVDAFSIVLLLLSTVVSPFLFAFRNKQIKKEIRKIFRFCPEELKKNSTKSFYKHNFSVSLKSQTFQLFTEFNKKLNLKEGREANVESPRQ